MMSQEAGQVVSVERDRFADLLRTLALGSVVYGHWLMAAVWHDADGVLRVDNVLNHARGLWPLTWVAVLVPLFFFVGGHVNATSWRRTQAAGGTAAQFIKRRLARLFVPIVPFLAFVGIGVGIALMAGAPRDLVRGITLVVVMPLWFIAVYAVLAMLIPPMVRLDARFGVAVWIVMALAAAGFDGLRFLTDNAGVAAPNYVLVWGLAQQIGIAYASGRWRDWTPRAIATWGGVVFVLLILAVSVGPWPPSMIGLSGERSNFAPPAVPALLIMGVQIAVVLLLRPALQRILTRPTTARRLDVASAYAMPAFLWHLPVLVMCVGLFLLTGVALPEPATATWWLTRLIVLPVLTVALWAWLRLLAKSPLVSGVR